MFFFPSVLSSFHSFEIYLTHILGVFGFQFSLIERIRRDSKTLVSISYCWAGAAIAAYCCSQNFVINKLAHGKNHVSLGLNTSETGITSAINFNLRKQFFFVFNCNLHKN